MRACTWQRILGGVRTRILAWYFLLTTLSSIGSIWATYEIFQQRLEQQAKRALQNDLNQFREMLPDENVADIAAVKVAIDAFLSGYQPVDPDDYVIVFVDGWVYRASVATIPEQITQQDALIDRWLALTSPEKSEAETPVGRIRYIAEPIRLAGQPPVVMVFIHRLDAAARQLNASVLVIGQTTLAALGLAAVLAWISAGRVLAPLNSLKRTAQSISASGLSQRIPVQGSDEIAELARTFNQMLDRLESAFASQKEFIKDASHELRTPITIIRGHLELMGEDPEERRETLALVTDELDRMGRFVHDLLLLARAERPDFLRPEWVDLQVFTDELYAKAQGLAARAWILEHRGSGLIWLDRQRITQAMMNLAQNATHFTQTGDPIWIGSTHNANQARFWVRDGGEGIPAEDQARIFERFARASNSQRRSEGAGLGLAIVQSIAKAHNGCVELSSRVGKGSLFTLILPAAPRSALAQRKAP